jgi:hypothetical protein
MNRVLDCANGNRRVLIDATNGFGTANFYENDKIIRTQECEWSEDSASDRKIVRTALDFIYREEK